MLIKQVIELFDVLATSTVDGKAVKDYLLSVNSEADVEVYPITGPKGESTDMVKVMGKTAITRRLMEWNCIKS